MSRTVGYMRVSTDSDKQTFRRQEHQLREVGITELYADKVSGSKRKRPALDKMLSELQEGDVVYINEISRLSRSTLDLLSIVQDIKDRGASLVSLHDDWLNTKEDNPLSEFLLVVMSALAEMERKQIVQRVKEGVNVAKAQAEAEGRGWGRPKKSPNKINHALELYHQGNHSVRQIEDITGVSSSTIYRRLREEKAKQVQQAGL